MSKCKDLVGNKYGRLTVISRNFEKQRELYNNKHINRAFWNCICECGNKVTVTSGNLKNRKNPTLSCGCLRNEVMHKQKNTKNIEWIFDEDIAIGIAIKGERFCIDKEDYPLVKDYCWRIDKYGYVVANRRDGSNKIIRLHDFIMMHNSKNTIVDHKNWDKTDNRKQNLRIATKSQNNINIKRKLNNTSGYTGVTYNKRTNRYIARISLNNKRIFLGSFKDINDAIEARHNAEIKLHGEWSGEINRKDYTKH